MEFLCIYWFFMFFVYSVCRLDVKPFFIWPYGFYIFIFAILFYFYLRVCRFVFAFIKAVVEFVRDKVKAQFTVKRNLSHSTNTNQAESETDGTETDAELEEKSLDNT